MERRRRAPSSPGLAVLMVVSALAAAFGPFLYREFESWHSARASHDLRAHAVRYCRATTRHDAAYQKCHSEQLAAADKIEKYQSDYNAKHPGEPADVSAFCRLSTEFAMAADGWIASLVDVVDCLVKNEPPPHPLAAPFGIARGTMLSALDRPRQRDDGRWQLASVPSRHPLLTGYLSVATHRAGVCEILGHTEFVPAYRADEIMTIIEAHVGAVLGRPTRFLRDDGWFWIGRPPLGHVALRRERDGSRSAVLLIFTFDNMKDCGAEKTLPMINPFR